MEFQEFCKQRNRMCEYYNHCEDCPLWELKGTCDECEEYCIRCPKKMEKAVSDWAKEHPIKTRKTEFMKLFPDCEICQDTYPSVDAFSLDCNLLGSGTSDNQWWDTEIKEEN